MIRPLIRSVLPIALVFTLSGCSWYMDMSNSIGSHMPTYDDWFGSGEKPKEQAQPGQYPYGTDPYTYGAPPPAPPRGQAMPQGYYPTERFAVPAEQPQTQQPPQYYAPPVTGQPASPGGVAPDQGLQMLQMQQQMHMQGGPAPEPYFTQPDLVAPEPMDDSSSLIEKQLPSDLPSLAADEPKKEEGMFAFLDDISETVGGWFGDSEDKAPYPNLASVPPKPDYASQHQEVARAAEELVADRNAAQAEQQRIDDWGDLVADAPSAGAAPEQQAAAQPATISPVALLPEQAAAIPAGQQIVYPKPAPEVSAAPQKEEWFTAYERKTPEVVAAVPAPMPEVAPAAAYSPRVMVPSAAAELSETPAEYLRAPEMAAPQGFLPPSRYTARRTADRLAAAQ